VALCEALWFGGLVVVVGVLVSLVVVGGGCVCGGWEQRWKGEMQHPHCRGRERWLVEN
jgi:hypothetical protein